MLAEIAMANAAFRVLIKEAIGNGKELYDVAGVVVTQFFDSKTDAYRKSQTKNGYKSDMHAFMELEKIRGNGRALERSNGLGRPPRHVG